MEYERVASQDDSATRASNVSSLGDRYGWPRTGETPRAVMALQRAAGNRAVCGHLKASGSRFIDVAHHSSKPSTSVSVQREPAPSTITKSPPGTTPSDADAIWTANRGPEMLTRVNAAIGRWMAFRKAPATNAAMQSIIQAVTDATNDVGADLDGLWVRDYCSGKLGPQGLNALGEMDSMTSAAMNVGISGKANSLFNIKKVDPGHKYVLTMQAADERKVPGAGLTYQVINHLTIRYTNRLGWAWTDTVSITGWQASLTVGVEADLKKKKIKPVPGITPGVDHLRIEFTSMIESERMMHYAGAADLSTAVTTFKPSASILVGVGASADLMYQVTFLTEPNALQFTERRGHVKTSGPKKKIKVSMTAEGGKGSAVATPSYDPVADLSSKPTPVKVTKTWDSVTVGPFETGKSDLPRGAAAALQGLQSAVAVWKAEEIDAAAPKLQELGFPPAPDFHLTIMVDGWASRRWRNAGKPGEKEAKNLVLSNIRARNVAALVSTIMGAGHRIDAQGHGEGVRVPEAMMRGSGPADLARLRSKAELIQVKDELTLRRRNLQLQVAAAEDDTRQDPGEREREIKKLNDEIFTIDYRLAEIQFYEQDRYGPNSDDETLRQVNVTASWEGYTVRLFDAGK